MDPKRSSAHVNALSASRVIWPMGSGKCMGGGNSGSRSVGFKKPKSQRLTYRSLKRVLHNFGELKVTARIAKNSVSPAKTARPEFVIFGAKMSSSRKALRDGWRVTQVALSV